MKKARTVANQPTQVGKEFNSNVILGKEIKEIVKDGTGQDKEIVKEMDSHHGPIYTISQHRRQTDLFLTVGDWSAKIWQEETLTPI